MFPQAALQELEELKQIVPKESLVYFLIGKVRMPWTWMWMWTWVWVCLALALEGCCM